MKSLFIILFIVYFIFMIMNIIIFNYLHKLYYKYLQIKYENYFSNTYAYHIYLYLYQLNNNEKKRIAIFFKIAYLIFRFTGLLVIIIILYFGINWLSKSF